jgi:hypothetical protein
MFKKEELVKMWMGSGLIPQIKDEKERPEDIGEKYVWQLARKSFFDLVPTTHPYSNYYKQYYIIHDLLHDLARNVSFGECLRLDSGGCIHDMHTIRHLWIANFSKLTVEDVTAISSFKSLRTLVIENSSGIDNIHITALEKVVQILTSLRLLSLKGIPMFCFAERANKHLRYVSFSGMAEVHGLSKLYHLQVLIAGKRIVIASEQLKKLGNLSNLRYVSYGTNGFGEFHVGGLTSLQELHNFQIIKKEGYQISSLRNLNSLCKLQICNLENIGSHGEVVEAELNKKVHLTSLSLNWSETNDAPKDDEDLIIDKLEPHIRLESLEIAGYNGIRFPTWINHFSVINKYMVSMELRRCRNWMFLPALGNLHHLKHLELQNLAELEQIGQPLDVSLPPNMKTLVVEGCKKLSELPLLPPSLARIEICDVGLTILPRIDDQQDNEMDFEGMPPQLVSVIISECSNLTSLEGSFLMQERYIKTLRVLNIVDCRKLKCAPLLFGKMNNLTEFSIGSCYLLRVMEKVDDRLLPRTLQELSIVQCGDLQLPLLASLPGLTNLTSLSLRNCSRVRSLPSSGVFKSLAALRELFVTECIALSSMGGLGALSHLAWLEITACEKLLEAANRGEIGHVVQDFSLQVYSLWVDSPRMLNMQPLRRLSNTKSLIISVVGYVNISDEWISKNESSLKRLEFDAPPSGMPFPDLPSSLESFIIRNCNPELEERWTRKETTEWNKISLIPRVRIGMRYAQIFFSHPGAY